MADGWDLVGKLRIDFADMVEGLTDDQLRAKTFCAEWTPHEVAGHLVSFTKLSLPALMWSMASKGFNADKAWVANATKFAAAPIGEIAADLRANATKPSAIKSFPAELSVTDAAIHTQDVRRPLGLAGSLPEDAVRVALDFCTSHKKSKMMVDPKHIAGLRLQATDMDWSWGEGAEVSGPAEAILMGINRRPVRDDLTGAGVAQLPT